MDNEIQYYILVWVWDGLDYKQKITYETTSKDDAEEKYEATRPTFDEPLIELYEVGEDEDKRIKYKEV